MSEQRIYLAGPFFNDEQRATMERIEAMCKERSLAFFSPRIECFCPPDATVEQRAHSFNANVEGIEHAPYVLARIDDFDPGTMWEMGFAFGAGVETFAFTTVEDRGLNLMLAESGVKIIQGWAKLEAFLNGDREAAIIWKKQII